MLLARSATLGVAESCTGGLIAQRLTSVAGSSRYFTGGFVTYSSELKMRLLGVQPDTLKAPGAVSEPVAREMAIGARRALGVDYAMSITGFAGPDGGTEADPVGTWYVGLAHPDGCDVRRFQFIGDRERIRMLGSQSALDMLRRKLLQ